MLSKKLMTPIDELVELVKNNNEVTTSFIKENINISPEIIERWLVVLDEYKILDIKYRGFEGYVTVIEGSSDKKDEKDIDINELKNVFLKKAKIKKLSFENISILWPKFVFNYESEIRTIFEKKAKAKGYNDNLIKVAWLKFKEDLIKL